MDVDILSVDILSVDILSVDILSVDILSVDIFSVDILTHFLLNHTGGSAHCALPFFLEWTTIDFSEALCLLLNNIPARIVKINLVKS